MLWEPMQFDDEPTIAVTTRTGKLLARVEAIEEQVTTGNITRYGAAVTGTVATTALVLGSTALSPLVSLLFFTGLGSATAGYISYVLFESATLKIAPVWVPTNSGELDQTLAQVLPLADRLHWIAIHNFGAESVEKLELEGGLDALLSSIKNIRVRKETKAEDFQNAIGQIENHFFPANPRGGGGSRLGGDRGNDRSTSRRSLPTANPVNDPWDNEGTSDRLTAVADNLPPVRDLPREIALLKGHVLLVAKTTAGKSTALCQVIKHCLEAGHNVLTLDGKGCLALRDAGGVYRHANTSDRAVDCLSDIRGIVTMLKTRQNLTMQGHTDFTPQTVIVDELNLIRKFLKRDSQALDEFTEMIIELLLQGASYKIYLRLSSHSSRLKNLGLDGGEADSLSFIGLGRNGSFESLEDILEYQINGRKSKKFQDYLDGLIHTEFKETLVFSTIAPMGFYRLPWVDQSSTAFTPPATTELDIRSSLDRLYQSSTAPEPPAQIEDTPSPSKIDSLSDEVLDELLAKVLDYAKRKGKVKPSDINSGIRSMREYTAQDITRLFNYLEGDGVGTVRGNEFIPD